MSEADPTARTLTLPDGRTLGYALFGAGTGPLVVYLNGTMGSRLEARVADGVGRRLGFRVVGVDRPGHGLSTMHHPRRFAAFAEDVRALADHLGASTFGLVGFSGGGAHAAAIASRLRDRLSRLVLVCPAAPPDATQVQADRPLGLRLTIALIRFTVLHLWLFAALLGWFVRRQGEAFFARMIRFLPVAGDRTALAQPWFRQLFADSWREGVRQGARGIARDLALQLRPWDVPAADPRCPVHQWYGKHDEVAPPSTAMYYETVFPRATTHILDGEAHLLLWNHVDEVFAPFAAAADGPRALDPVAPGT